MAPFDPYHKWLAIPPEEQPPNHYRLLALPLFESDADVIEMAAEQRTLLLRTFQTGPNSELAERLLNEVSEARVCLLIAEDKARYDTQLKASQQPAQPVAEETVPEEAPVPLVTPQRSAASKRPSTRTQSRRRPAAKPLWQQPWVMATVGVVAVVLLLIFFNSGGNESKPKRNPNGTGTGNVTIEKAGAKSLPASLQEGLIAYYPFNGNANDESGGGNDAEVRGALLSVDRHGKPRKAYSFDGTDQISVQRPTGLQAMKAVNCWFKTNAIGANQYLVDLGTINNNWMEILRNGKLLAANTTKAQIHTGQFAAGQWYMVTRTYDGSYLSVFINGRLSASLETPEEVPTGINIGANGKGQFGLNGSLDDVRIYNRALSAAEVKALYEFEKP